MVEKHFCDRCGKGIDIQSDDFYNLFNSVSSAIEKVGKESQITQPQLCRKCEKGYKKIIKETNKKIADYLSKR